MSFTLYDSEIYQDGKNLDTARHARNLYRETRYTEDSRKGIYNKLNGGLYTSDLNSNFRLKKDYVWPGLMAQGHSSSALIPVEYFSDASPSGGADYDEGYLPERYGLVAGTSIRFFLPYASLCLIDLSTYFSIWRPFYVNDDDSGVVDMPGRDFVISRAARFRLVVDNNVVQDRGLPFSAQMSPAETGGDEEEGDAKDDGKYSVGDIRNHEAGQGFHMSLHAQRYLSAGWHEAHLEYRLDPGTLNQYTSVKRGKKVVNSTIRASSRIFCGIRSARVLALRKSRREAAD